MSGGRVKKSFGFSLFLIAEVIVLSCVQGANHNNLIKKRKDYTVKRNVTLASEKDELLHTSTSDPRSFILEKYGRHYRLNGDTKIDPSLTFDITTGKRKDNIPAAGILYSDDEEGKSPNNLEYGLSDVKSIIMEKYGRHYRLTGGSTLAASKRNKGEPAVIVSVTNITKNDNDTLQFGNSSQAVTNMEGKNLANGTSIENQSESMPPKSVANESLANLNSTDISNNTLARSVINGASKAEIENPIEKGVGKENVSKPPDTTMALPVTKNETDHNGTQEIVFGSPPPPPQTGDSENNITEEGNLTTITIDLTKGNTSAVIPGLDVLKSPVQSVDVIVDNGKNGDNPKRSGTSGNTHKKHISFEITKPRMSITDFANKRKHVPHGRHKKCKKHFKRKLIHHHYKCRKTLSENRGPFA